MLDPTSAALEVDAHGIFSLDRVTTIGRAPESNIVLKLPSISRHHARIFFEGGHFWIKDLDSANGTTVNGKRTKLQMLSDGDKIVFGEARAVFYAEMKSSGPARLARDPMEGADPQIQDGTPTSGLIFPPWHPERKTQDVEAAPVKSRSNTASETRRAEASGGSGSETLEMDREAASLKEENERLKRLVAQLERALADSNLRLRNLQKRLDRKE